MSNDKQPENKTTVLQSVVSGSVAGAAEVTANHPFWTVKTDLQMGKPLSFYPSSLYRGFFLNLSSMMPITAVQVGLNRFVQKYAQNDPQQPTNAQRIQSSLVAGVGSGLVSGPTELVMTQQRERSRVQPETICATTKHLYAYGGIKSFAGGLFATMLRDGGFAGCALGLGPVLKEQFLNKQFGQHTMNETTATFAAGLAAGTVSSLATHAVDTVKTAQQSADPHQVKGFMDTTADIYAEKGAKAFAKGLLPRWMRVVSAVTIIGAVSEKMETVFKERNASKKNRL